MKLKRFEYWRDLLDYLSQANDSFILLETSNLYKVWKYRIRRYKKEKNSTDILLETDSREEVKIWIDLRGYGYKELLIDDCSNVYCVELEK